MMIIMIIVTMILVVMIYLLFYLFSYKIMTHMESSSSYECGFNLINSTRISFSYRFFLIGILFLIFDVEIVLMLSIPYLILNKLSIMMIILFFMILILGLMYEYYWGSLEWVY